MKLPIETEPDPEKEVDWPKDAVFEYDRFGGKIMVWPGQGVWVKDCVTGKPVLKENTKSFRQGKDKFYYLTKGSVPPASDLADDLIPSKWDEDS